MFLQIAVIICFIFWFTGYGVFEKYLKEFEISYYDIASITVILRLTRLTEFFSEIKEFMVIRITG